MREAKDMQKVWNKLKIMRNGINIPSCQIQMENCLFPTNEQKAEAFVNMFAKVSRLEGLDEAKRIKRVEAEKINIYQDPIPDNSNFMNSLITIQELKDAINSLTNKKTSVGIDAISNEMIKHLPENWIHILQSIFCKIWTSGDMPLIWKHSIVVPIHKQGKPRINVNSYRPIALTSHVCKLMEKIVLARLVHLL